MGKTHKIAIFPVLPLWSLNKGGLRRMGWGRSSHKMKWKKVNYECGHMYTFVPSNIMHMDV